jgi:hypothetical protein
MRAKPMHADGLKDTLRKRAKATVSEPLSNKTSPDSDRFNPSSAGEDEPTPREGGRGHFCVVCQRIVAVSLMKCEYFH